MIAEYNIEGRILILPIRGQGPANITVGERRNILQQFGFDSSLTVFLHVCFLRKLDSVFVFFVLYSQFIYVTVDGTYNYETDLAVEAKDGKDYLVFKNEPKLENTFGRFYYSLENLFNGDKRLG